VKYKRHLIGHCNNTEKYCVYAEVTSQTVASLTASSERIEFAKYDIVTQQRCTEEVRSLHIHRGISVSTL